MLHHEEVPEVSRRDWKDLLNTWPEPVNVRALVGPEGGFTRSETDQAKEAGFEVLGLGPRILRSETAAIALMSILGFELGDLVNF